MKQLLKQFIKSVLESCGYQVRRIREFDKRVVDVDDVRHSTIRPNSTFSPWLTDDKFQKTYSAIRHNTVVDIYRCYELWHLTGQVSKLDGDLIQIGVWRGGTGCLIAQKCKLENIPATVYLCDTFKGVVKAGAEDPAYRGGEYADASKSMVEDFLKQQNVENAQVLEGIFPDETGAALEDRRIRLCHIDVDVYQSAKDVTEWIWERVVVGGILIYDDYGMRGCEGITHFINQEASKKDRHLIYNLNGHAIVLKLR